MPTAARRLKQVHPDPAIPEQRARILRYHAMDPEEKIKFREREGLRVADIFSMRSPQAEGPMTSREAASFLGCSFSQLEDLKSVAWVNGERKRRDTTFSSREILEQAAREGLSLTCHTFYSHFSALLDHLPRRRPRASWVATAKVFQRLRDNKRYLEEWKGARDLARALAVGLGTVRRKLAEGAYPAKEIHILGEEGGSHEWRIAPDDFHDIVLRHRIICNMLDDWETTADLAKRLGLTAGWVRGLIRDGKIPAVQIPPTRKGDPGTTWRIYPGFSRSLDVEAFQRKTRKTPARPLVETKKSRHAIETQTIEEFSEDAKEMERQRLELIGRIIAYSKRANAERLEEFTRRGVAGLKPKQMEAEEAVSIRVAKSIVGLSRHETLEQKCKQGKIPGARRKGKSMYWEIPVAWVNEQYRLGQTHLSAKEFLMACEQVGIPITRDTYYRRIALHGTRHISYEMLFSFEYFVKLLTLWNEEQRARRSGLTLRQLALRAGVHRITVRQIVGKNHFKTARVRTLAGTEMIIIPHPECRRLLNGLREEKYGAARAARRIEEKLDRQNVQRDVYAAVEKLGIGKRSFRGRLLVAPEHYPEVLRQLQRWEKQRKNYLPRRHARKQFALIVNGLQIPPEETQALLQLNYKGANDEQAEKLWILARQGNDRAFEIIAQGFMPFIRYVAYQYYRHIPLGDKRQFGLWGLLQAVSHWGALPEGNKAQTNGYARAYIRGAVLRECRKELLPRGKASFSLLSAMELGIELPERKEPGLEIAPGINFIPWQLSE